MEWNDKWQYMVTISVSLIIMGENQRFVTEELTEDLTEDIVCAGVVPFSFFFFFFFNSSLFFFDWYYTKMVFHYYELREQ